MISEEETFGPHFSTPRKALPLTFARVSQQVPSRLFTSSKRRRRPSQWPTLLKSDSPYALPLPLSLPPSTPSHSETSFHRATSTRPTLLGSGALPRPSRSVWLESTPAWSRRPSCLSAECATSPSPSRRLAPPADFASFFRFHRSSSLDSVGRDPSTVSRSVSPRPLVPRPLMKQD